MACGERAGARVLLDRRAAVLPRQRVTGQQLADVFEDRERSRYDVERQECVESVEIDVAVLERVQLGGEAELPADVAIRERLDPEAIACEHEPAFARIPDRDREHSTQPLPQLRTPLLVAVHEHFGVAARAEAVAGALELVHQLAVVVDLAVLHDDDGAVLVRDRLIAAGEVDDREPPRRDSDRPVDMRPLGVGAPVVERGGHPAEPFRVDGSASGRDPADPAHSGPV